MNIFPDYQMKGQLSTITFHFQFEKLPRIAPKWNQLELKANKHFFEQPLKQNLNM